MYDIKPNGGLFFKKHNGEVKSTYLPRSLWNIFISILKMECCHLKCETAAQLHSIARHWNEMHCFAEPSATCKQVWLNSIICWRRQICVGLAGHWIHTEHYIWADWLNFLDMRCAGAGVNLACNFMSFIVSYISLWCIFTEFNRVCVWWLMLDQLDVGSLTFSWCDQYMCSGQESFSYTATIQKKLQWFKNSHCRDISILILLVQQEFIDYYWQIRMLQCYSDCKAAPVYVALVLTSPFSSFESCFQAACNV